MKVVHILRKPLSEGSVSANVLKHGCGGLNINGTRIRYEAGHEPPKDANVDKPSSWEGEEYNGDQPYILNAKLKTRQVYTAEGRFPANLILQHLEGCQKDGVKEMRRDIRDATGAGAGVQTNDHKGGGQWKSSGRAVGSTTETVAKWLCVEGCPVAALDAQTEPTVSKRTMRGVGWNDSEVFGSGDPSFDTARGYDDAGGASRFFKQTSDIHDLVEYLDRLIRPVDNPILLTVMEHITAQLSWEDLPPSSVHGAILDTANYDKAVFDILKPGGHLLMVGSPQDFKMICLLEDLGFEVRDSICVLDSETDKAHYIPKASRSEKESGCWNLEPNQLDPSRSEDKVGGNRPHNRGARKRQNSHPTVKPVAVMEACLNGVGSDGPVVDPFMGSGTTMLACLNTKRDGIGIERDPQYIKIADARVRHWNRSQQGWTGAKIESDVAANVEESEEVSLLEFFHIGGDE